MEAGWIYDKKICVWLFKDDVSDVTEGYECGIGVEGFKDQVSIVTTWGVLPG